MPGVPLKERVLVIKCFTDGCIWRTWEVSEGFWENNRKWWTNLFPKLTCKLHRHWCIAIMLYVSHVGIAFCMEEYIDPTTIKFHHICYRECFRGIVTIIRRKLRKGCVLWMNNSRIHRNMKIAWDDSAVKLGSCNWCGLSLNAPKKISEQALSCLLEGWSM